MKGKISFAIFATLALLLAFTPKSSVEAVTKKSPAQVSEYRLYIDGLKYAANPYKKNGKIMVPLRVIAEKAGYTYTHITGTSTFAGNGKVFSLKTKKDAYKFDKKTVSYGVAPEITDNRFYVPANFLVDALGMSVEVADNQVKVTLAKVKPGKLPEEVTRMSLYLNGKKISGEPYKIGKTVMLPLRAVTTKLGYTYSVIRDEKYSGFAKSDEEYKIYWGKNSFPIDGKLVKLERGPATKDSILYVPSSFFTKEFGYKVSVSGLKVTITTKK